ncbi:MAG: hypothetical protein L0Y35_04225 [Flammeovirgaceae bacterium]|nr:hypothetical protein [Flammeovirgaceae bacterium]
MKKVGTLIILMSLVAWSDARQIIKTQIHITVRNELGNTEEGVSVSLYANEEDYKAEKNAVVTGTTDAKGMVKFKELKPIAYYLLAQKGDLNNFGGGEQTGKLQEGRINKVTVVIQ